MKVSLFDWDIAVVDTVLFWSLVAVFILRFSLDSLMHGVAWLGVTLFGDLCDSGRRTPHYPGTPYTYRPFVPPVNSTAPPADLEQPLLKTAPPLPVPGEESEELAIHQHTILEQGAAEAIHPVPPPAPVVRPPKRLDDDIVPTEPLFDDCWAPMIIELAFDDGWHSAQAHIGVVNMSWHNVVANRLQWSQLRAISTAIFKLLVLHWLQPLGYMLAFYLYQENLDTLQLILGLIVLGRECVYIILTLYSLYLTPTFLLMDTHATMVDKGTANLIDKGGFVYVVCFALAPEKFVMITILRDNQYNKKVWVSLMVLNILCDMAGIAALISAMITDTVFPALAVGYGATTVSGIVALLWLLSLFDIIDLRWCIQ